MFFEDPELAEACNDPSLCRMRWDEAAHILMRRLAQLRAVRTLRELTFADWREARDASAVVSAGPLDIILRGYVDDMALQVAEAVIIQRIAPAQ